MDVINHSAAAAASGRTSKIAEKEIGGDFICSAGWRIRKLTFIVFSFNFLVFSCPLSHSSSFTARVNYAKPSIDKNGHVHWSLHCHWSSEFNPFSGEFLSLTLDKGGMQSRVNERTPNEWPFRAGSLTEHNHCQWLNFLIVTLYTAESNPDSCLIEAHWLRSAHNFVIIITSQSHYHGHLIIQHQHPLWGEVFPFIAHYYSLRFIASLTSAPPLSLHRKTTIIHLWKLNPISVIRCIFILEFKSTPFPAPALATFPFDRQFN